MLNRLFGFSSWKVRPGDQPADGATPEQQLPSVHSSTVRDLATEASLASAIDGTPGVLVNFWSYTQRNIEADPGHPWEPINPARPHRHR